MFNKHKAVHYVTGATQVKLLVETVQRIAEPEYFSNCIHQHTFGSNAASLFREEKLTPQWKLQLVV